MMPRTIAHSLPSAFLFRIRRCERFAVIALLAFVSGLLQFSARAQAATPSLVARWVASPDPTVIGYKVYYGAESGIYTNAVDAGASTNATVSGLVPNVTYYFIATAYDAAGAESDPSNEASGNVPSVNQAPTLAGLSDLSLSGNAGLQIVNLAGITSGAINELQTLTVTASSSNPALIPTPTVSYTSPNLTGTLTFAPASNAAGNAVITVTVNDGGPSNNIVTRTFTVTVSRLNQPPTITTIPTQNILSGTSTSPIAFAISDAETPASNLILSAQSSNPALIPTSRITFGGSNSSRTVTLTPLASQSGNAVITISVSDGSVTTGTLFQLVVKARPAPPGNLMVTR